jgi:hypothetical protein
MNMYFTTAESGIWTPAILGSRDSGLLGLRADHTRELFMPAYRVPLWVKPWKKMPIQKSTKIEITTVFLTPEQHRELFPNQPPPGPLTTIRDTAGKEIKGYEVSDPYLSYTSVHPGIGIKIVRTKRIFPKAGPPMTQVDSAPPDTLVDEVSDTKLN